MSQAASPSQLIGGQLIVASDNSDLPSSLRQAESQIMTAASQQQWSGDGTSQAATNSVDLGLDAQAVPLNDQQLSQAVDGSLFVGLFGSQSTQTAQEPGVVGSQSAVMAEGEEGSSGSGDSSQDDPMPIPHVDFPQLRFTQGGVSPDNFIPTGLSSFTDTRGSMGPFVGGSNWVHTVTVDWIDEQNWTYTETLTMRFLVGDVTSDGGPLDFSTPDDAEEGTEDEEPVDDRLQTQGTWSSMVGSLRGGHVQLTFNARRGNTSATANSPWFNIFGSGTRWNVSLSFSDTVVWYAQGSASSTAHIDSALIDTGTGEGEGSGDTPDDNSQLPDDFTGSADWSGTFYSTQTVSGTLTMSSTPFWVTQGSTPQTSVVDRLIIASGSTTLQSEFSETEEFKSSSQSGNLTPAVGTIPEEDPVGPNNPLPRGGREDIDFEEELEKHEERFAAMNQPDGQGSGTTGGQGSSGQGTSGGTSTPESGDSGDDTEDPGDEYEGHGSASAVSSGRSGGGNSNQTGNWNFTGVFREQSNYSRWMAGLGNAASQAQAALDAQGRSDARVVVIPEPEVVPNPFIGGTTTYSGKVIAGYNAKISGDGTASDSATAVLNVDYATGELIVEPDEDAQAQIESDVNGGGKQFLTVEARMDESGQINNYAAGTGELVNWSPTVAYKTVKHHSESVGTTLGDAFSTIVDGGPPSVGATLKSDGSGYELYETTHYQDLDVYHSGTLSHTLDQIADGNTTLVRRDQEKIDLTGQLQNDQPVWTGTAYREVKGNLNYKDKFDGNYELGAYNKRDAELTKTATYRSDFNPVTRQIVNTGSNNGAQVGITGSLAMCNGCLFGDGELEVTPHTTLTDYEAALQAIFEDWDGSEVILPPDEPPPPPTNPDPEPLRPRGENAIGLAESIRSAWDWISNVGGAAISEIDDGLIATIDGIIPFGNPFQSYYANADGSVDEVYEWSQFFGGASRDVALAAFIPNLSAFARNPVLYELGSVTMPYRLFSSLEHMSVVERGAALYRHLGYGSVGLSRIAQAGDYMATVPQLLTPLGWLGVIGTGHTTDYVHENFGWDWLSYLNWFEYLD
jgi:hypothetical protein